MCVICMKHRIIFYYHQPVSNSIIVYCKHLTHARTRERAHAHVCARTRANASTPPHAYTPPSLYRYSMPANRDGPLISGSLSFEINTGTGGQVSRLRRTDTRTRERMYCQTIRTVRYIFRDDRARIATCSLRTPTDRLNENYSIDNYCIFCDHLALASVYLCILYNTLTSCAFSVYVTTHLRRVQFTYPIKRLGCLSFCIT